MDFKLLKDDDENRLGRLFQLRWKQNDFIIVTIKNAELNSFNRAKSLIFLNFIYKRFRGSGTAHTNRRGQALPDPSCSLPLSVTSMFPPHSPTECICCPI